MCLSESMGDEIWIGNVWLNAGFTGSACVYLGHQE